MDEIRFNRPEFNQPKLEQVQNTDVSKKKLISKKIFKAAFFGVIVILAIVLIWFLNGIMRDETSSSASPYSAIFLSNDQVYFGKIKSKDVQEIVLTDVYYLQLSGGAGSQAQLSEPKFSIIKLGNELHGPTDEMFINMQNVLFYENLRSDSKVVESIKNLSK